MPLCITFTRRLCHNTVVRGFRFTSTSSHQSGPALSNESSQPKLLHHDHLLMGHDPRAPGLLAYDLADITQESTRFKLVDWKTGFLKTSSSEAPPPTLISFECLPTFTFGRRQDDLPASQLSRLKSIVTVNLPNRVSPITNLEFVPAIHKTKRGGLTTYHGPGQLVLWPVIDMHSDMYEKFTVYSYAALLESTTRRFLSQLYGIQTYTNDEPGVWVATKDGEQPRKIAAMGVHHRRYTTGLGIALNVDVPVTGGEHVNPWARFVPCGLEGKAVTSIEAEVGPQAWDMRDMAEAWAAMFEEGLLDPSKRTFEGQGR